MLPDEDDNSTFGDNDAPEPREPSLREIAEAAYDDVSEDNQDDGEDGPSDRGDGRDRRGRFAANKERSQTGEAEDEPPSPDKPAETQTQPDPARGSNQPPEHWSAEDRAAFDRLPPDAKNFFMRRYSEMEADYTRKSQANAQAVQAVNALTPIFQDPDIARSLQENQLHPIQAVQDWARMHKAAISPDYRVRASTLYEIAERMGFDPAKVFATNRQPEPQLPDHLQKDPAVQFFANQASRTEGELQALRAQLQQLQQFQQTETQRSEDEALQRTRQSIDSFADEKGQDGRPLRPYFDRVMQRLINAYKMNPQQDMQQVYDEACWADPQIRKELMHAEWSRQQHSQSNQRAQQAVRSNVRGLTSPVSKPSQEKKGNGSLRDTLENSADEVGF